MNHRYLALLAIPLSLCLLAACGTGSSASESQSSAGQSQTDPAEDAAEITESRPSTEDEAVALAVLDRAQTYASGECPAEGHTILRSEPGQDEDTLVIYALCSAGNYGFVNGNLEEISGSGVIPSRLTFALGGDGFLTLVDYWEPEDGSGYADSIRQTFPADLVDQAMNAGDQYLSLLNQKAAYAQTYLQELGREADIGEYADFDHPLATDQGMSVAVSNALMEQMPDYPFFLGSKERLEDGVRWIYENAWESDGNTGGTATYTKSNYETGEIADQHIFQVQGDSYTEVSP